MTAVRLDLGVIRNRQAHVFSFGQQRLEGHYVPAVFSILLGLFLGSLGLVSAGFGFTALF